MMTQRCLVAMFTHSSLPYILGQDWMIWTYQINKYGKWWILASQRCNIFLKCFVLGMPPMGCPMLER